MTTDHPDTTTARLDRQTARIQVPVPHGARRVRMTITGTWSDPKGDPTPALLEVRTLGGPSHRPQSPERSRHAHELRLSVDSDTTEDLPEGCVGVDVEVKRRSPAMALVVRLQRLDGFASNASIIINRTVESEHAARATAY